MSEAKLPPLDTIEKINKEIIAIEEVVIRLVAEMQYVFMLLDVDTNNVDYKESMEQAYADIRKGREEVLAKEKANK